MGLKINTTTPALNAQRQANAATRDVQKTLAGLASGLQIKSAADDAAGLAISERFRTQVRQYTQEVNNLQTGVNVVQTADQALGTQQEGIGRLQELATQAANGTLTNDQRAALNNEAQQIVQQIDQTAQNTEFNGVKLLDGTTGSLAMGTESGTQINVNTSTAGALNLNGVNLATQEGAAAALGTLQTAAEQVGSNRASLGAQERGLTSAIEARQGTTVNLQESESRIRDLDMARGVMENTKSQMALQRSVSALVQGNVIPQAAAQLLGTR
jgi:flagellin